MNEDEGLLLEHAELPQDDVAPEVLAAQLGDVLHHSIAPCTRAERAGPPHVAVAAPAPLTLGVARASHVGLQGKRVRVNDKALGMVPQDFSCPPQG